MQSPVLSSGRSVNRLEGGNRGKKKKIIPTNTTGQTAVPDLNTGEAQLYRDESDVLNNEVG